MPYHSAGFYVITGVLTSEGDRKVRDDVMREQRSEGYKEGS